MTAYLVVRSWGNPPVIHYEKVFWSAKKAKAYQKRMTKKEQALERPYREDFSNNSDYQNKFYEFQERYERLRGPWCIWSIKGDRT